MCNLVDCAPERQWSPEYSLLKAMAQMADERVRRRFAAILAADVVGNSRLMEEDENGTLAACRPTASPAWSRAWANP